MTKYLKLVKILNTIFLVSIINKTKISQTIMQRFNNRIIVFFWFDQIFILTRMIPFARIGSSHWTTTVLELTGLARTLIGGLPGTTQANIMCPDNNVFQNNKLFKLISNLFCKHCSLLTHCVSQLKKENERNLPPRLIQFLLFWKMWCHCEYIN